MNTRDSAGFNNLFLNTLEESPNLAEKDREGALKAWVTRHANEGFAEAERAKALRAAGDEAGARIADRRVDHAARKLREKLQVLQDHVGRAVPLQNVVGRRIAAAFEGKINIPPPKPRDPHAIGQGAVIDTAQRMGIRPAPKPDPKGEEAQNVLDQAGVKRKPGTDPSADWHDRHRPPESVKKPEPPKAPPKEFKHEGKWKDIRDEYQKHREKAREQGFERVDVQAPQKGGEGMKHRGYEFLEHWDGRRIEYHLEHDKDKNEGKLKVIEHASDRPVYEPGAAQKNPQKDVKGNPGMMKAAHQDRSLIVANKKISTERESGETHKVEFKDGSAAIYKPAAGAGLAKIAGIRHSIKENKNIAEKYRDLAAYKISEAAGFNIVPHVELVDYKIGTPGGGHAMAWIEGKARPADWREDAHSGHPDMHRMAALDWITGNTDRHPGNMMQGKSGRYYAIDNGLAFPDDTDPREYRSHPHKEVTGQKIPQEVKNEIRALKPEHIAAAMKESGFSDRDIKAVQARHAVLAKLDTWEPAGKMWKDAAKEGGVKLPHNFGGYF